MSIEEVNAIIVKHFFKGLADGRDYLKYITVCVAACDVPQLCIYFQYRNIWLLCLAA